ncbi:response regulator transcription factor [Paenibacillus soyae]|uniref:Response regulator n=1 Tax=Paenibacillus soyae TaxID=2969249 RepID=A0A9X2MWL6_9BACL|nr:response regulator [Paenibacillus soyae]MCR2807166.1 response regulator [Paenibacillus soyae]
MWTAMIVDDEPIIRFGIKASVDWAREGIRIVADCANGAEALEQLEEEPVDILITDIKMPVLDGLALTKQALAKHPRMKVVLVSSHNDFEYVREGLKLGVTDYILKHTLEPEELLQVLRRCKDQLEKESPAGGGRRSGEEDRTLARKRYEGELKQHLLQKSEGLPEGGYPDWLDGDFLGAVILLNKVHSIEEQEGYLHKSVLLEQMMEHLYENEPEGIAVQTGENELLFLMPKPPQGAAWEADASGSRLRGLASKLEEDGAGSVTIGYTAGSGAGAIREAYALGRKAADRGFFEGSGIYAYDAGRDLEREGSRLPGLYQEQADDGEEKLAAAIAEWRRDWSKGGCPPLRLKEEASRVLSVLFKRQVDPYTLVESFDRLFKSETLGELCDTLQASVAELRKARPSGGFEGPGAVHPIDKSLDYIRTHYLEPMTLQQVADYVHVSKNYFSILFKKVTGENFIDYVIKLRVQRAKELLAGSELKVYEVAEQSGFGDVKYFSKLFKKITGRSPVDYRELEGEVSDEG